MELLSGATSTPLIALSCISYNIFIRPPFVRNNGTSDRKSERLLVIQEELLKFDIICLQEIFSFASGRKEKFLNWLRGKGYHCTDTPSPSLLSGRFIDSGLVIASRFPVLHSDHLTYTNGSGVDAYVAKGCLYVKLLCKSKQDEEEIPIHVFNTHLQAGYDSGRETHEANRLLQMAEMKAFLETKTKLDSDPILIFGDFNVNGRAGKTDGKPSEGYRDMMQRIFPANFQLRDILFDKLGEHPITINDVTIDSITGQEKPIDLVLTNRSDVGKRQRLDYIFFAQKSQTEEKRFELETLSAEVQPFFVKHPLFTQLSDHYAVTASISIKRI